MATSEIRGEQRFNDNVTLAGSTNDIKVNSVNGTAINPLVPTDYTRITQIIPSTHRQVGTVVARTEIIGVLRKAATLVYVDVILGTKPTSTDTVTVDIQYWNGSAWATVLSAPISYSTSDSNNLRKSGTLTVTSLSADWALRSVVAITGSAGSDLFVEVGRIQQGT